MSEYQDEYSGGVFANRYEILNLLGSGGMGAVYFAKDKFLGGNLVAIKILHRQWSRNKEYVERFLREVRAMRQVSHPNVIRSFDAGEFQGTYFYTMECLRGTRLSELIANHNRSNPMPWQTIENIAKQACAGLQAIHDSKLVHRDLKPENIFLEDEDVLKITDLGVVREKNSSLTQSFAILGTLDYVAPEIWSGGVASPQSDIYALGLVLYELLTGEFPFQAENPSELMKLHLTASIPSVCQVRADVPPWIDHFLRKMLAKSFEKRFQSANAVLRMIESPPKDSSGWSGRSSGANPIVPSSSRRTLRQDEAAAAVRRLKPFLSALRREPKKSASASRASADAGKRSDIGSSTKMATVNNSKSALSAHSVSATIIFILVCLVAVVAYPQISLWVDEAFSAKSAPTAPKNISSKK